MEPVKEREAEVNRILKPVMYNLVVFWVYTLLFLLANIFADVGMGITLLYACILFAHLVVNLFKLIVNLVIEPQTSIAFITSLVLLCLFGFKSFTLMVDVLMKG
jgi:hypothetical protein